MYWFKSNGNFTEVVDFAFWWSCIRKGLRSKGLPPLVIYIYIKINIFIKEGKVTKSNFFQAGQKVKELAGGGQKAKKGKKNNKL